MGALAPGRATASTVESKVATRKPYQLHCLFKDMNRIITEG